MRPGTVVLAHGPLDPPGLWSSVAAGMRNRELLVVAPELTLGGAPYSVGWVAGMARPLHHVAVPTPLVLVGHGTAGPLLPALARTQRAARRPVGGYVFVDASLPRSGQQTHLDLLRAADPTAAARVHHALHGAPDDNADSAAESSADSALPSPALAADHAFWTEPIPPAVDWPDAPCAYLRSGQEHPAVGPIAWWARSAEQRGWLVDEADGDLDAALVSVIDRLAG